MDRPSERSTTLDPTTPEGRGPASPDPEEPDEAAGADDRPGADDAAVDDAGLDDPEAGERGAGEPGAGQAEAGARGAIGPDAVAPETAGSEAAAPGGDEAGDEPLSDDTPDVPGSRAVVGDLLDGGSADSPPDAPDTEAQGGDTSDDARGDDAPEDARGDDAPEDDAPAGEPDASADPAAVVVPDLAANGERPATSGDEGAGHGAAPDEEAGDQVADGENAGDQADDGEAGDDQVGDVETIDAETADAETADDQSDDRASGDDAALGENEVFRAPIDVQVIALALVEAATEDAAKLSPPPTAAPTPAPEPEPAAPPVPPFPMPVPPVPPARDTYGTARDAVVGRARDLRAWLTGTGPDGDASAEAATRNRRIRIGAAAGVVVLLAVYLIAAFAQAGVVPRGTTVAGTEVGGQSTAEAAGTLAEALSGRAAEPVELVAGEASTTLDPVAAGLSVDVSGTADSLTGFSLSPARMWRHLFGAGPAAPVLDVNDEAFASAVGGLEESMAVAPVNGAVEFADVKPAATPARDGTRIDPDAAGRAITSAWLVADGPVELPTQVVPPEITQEETDAALAQAGKVVSGPVEVSVGGQQAQLPPKVLAAATSFVEKDGELALRLDGATLRQAIVERTDNLLTTADGAQFSFASGRPEVVGGQLGTTLADKPTRTAIRAAALGDDRTATLEVVQQTPENSTQALRAMGVEEVVAEFSTPLTSDYVRTQNLIRGAEMITGDLIRPGETFSLVSALSPITLANGYVNSGMIIGGQHIDGVGGGLSQMATTTYNAAMIAGFEDVEHYPHSYWFERYPAGREATIAVGSKDMKVRNNTPYGAVMQSWVADNQLHVRIWSTKFLKNTWIDGPKQNIVPPGVVNSTGAGCVAYGGGQPGFTITVGRKVERIDNGKVVIERSYTTTYRPDHALACVTPEPPEPPETPELPDGDDTAPTPPGPEG